MISERDTALFNDSFERCLRKPGFLDRFYEIFLGSSDEVAEKFRNTDFNKQAHLLKASLYFLMLASSGAPGTTAHLERIAASHSRGQLNIRPELYDLWLSCLLQTVQEFDPSLDAETEGAWRRVLEFGIACMKSKY